MSNDTNFTNDTTVSHPIKSSTSLDKESLKTILNNTREAIIYFSLLSFKPIDCNEKVCSIFKTTSSTVFLKTHPGKFYTDRLSAGLSVDQFFKKIVDHSKKMGTYDFVYQARKYNGQTFIAEARAVYVGKDPSHPKLIIFLNDITERYETQKKLNKLLNQQSQIIDSIPAPFLFKDLNNNILACNKAMVITRDDCEHPSELIGKNLDEFLTKKEADKAYEEDLEIVATGKPLSILTTIKDSKGQKQWFKTYKTPYIDEHNVISGILSYIVDITEIMDQNERLKKYIESNNQLENFTAIASHDLQAPLRTIHSYTQLLTMSLKEKLHTSEREYMQFIINATSNMRHLIGDLRAFSRVDVTQLNCKKFEVNGLLNEIISELHATIEYTNAVVSIPENALQIQGDRIKIKQLFQNLITNALKYMPKEKTPKVQISFEDHLAFWHFKIKDNGIGIAPKNQQKIFELFQRLHGESEYQGTGIGLSLCKKVVNQHQGIIEVNSDLGSGCTFHFTIAKNIKSVDELIGR